MKKFFALAAILALVFAACESPDEKQPEDKLPSLTIRNQSSFELSNVTFSGITFSVSGSNDLPISGQAVKPLSKEHVGNAGYITFTRKDIGIALRVSAPLLVDEDSTFNFLDSTVVEEVANTSNRRTLAQISFLSQLAVERDGRAVAKNEMVNLGESVINTPKQNDFIVRNTGSGKLLFTGNEPVKISGSGADAFSAVQPSSSEVASNSPLPFKINFNPGANQTYTATVTISSNDQDGDFSFTITATGVEPKPIAIILYDNNKILQDDPIDFGNELITLSKNISIIIKNEGTAVLTIDTANIAITGTDAAAFTRITTPAVSIQAGGQTQFIIEWKPEKQGENAAILTIPTNDNSRNPVVVHLRGNGVQGTPILELTQGITGIGNNQIAAVDFGTVIVGNSALLTFTIKNTGDVALELTGTPVIESSSPSVFSVTTPPASGTINPGNNVQFVMRYQPADEGQDNAEITINNNSGDMLFKFRVSGTGKVLKPAAVIMYEDGVSVIPQNGTLDAGSLLVTHSKTITVIIQNTGEAELTIGTVTITGADAAAFEQISTPGASLPAEWRTSFEIKWEPVKTGENNATISIPTNDNSRNPVVIHLKGNGVQGTPVLDLTQGSTTITNNSLTPVDFETVEAGSSKTLNFTIKNKGDVRLELLGSPAVNSSNPAVFTVSAQPTAMINPEGSTSFSIQYAPTVEKDDSATITIINNSGNSPFVFTVKGSCHEKKPQITIQQGSTTIIPNGEHDFGTVATTDVPKTITFTIGNSGEANLTFVTNVNLGNNAAEHFTVSQPVSSVVPADGTTTFTVSFNPKAEGSDLFATVQIKTNSRDNSDFSFTVKGNGYVKKPQIAIKQGSTIINLHGEHNFNTVAIGETTTPITFTIGNSGEANLTFEVVDGNRVNLEGNTGNHFTVTQPSASVIPDGTTTFTVSFNPQAVGNNLTAVVRIKTNSQDNDDFSFTVKGIGILSVPGGVSAVFQSPGSILVSWNPVPGAASYNVYYGTSSSAITNLAASAVSGTSYTHTDLLDGTTYYYCVTAKADDSESARSQTVSMITLPGIPGNFRSTSSKSNSITLEWSAVTGATSYNVYYATSDTGSKTLAGTAIGTSYTHSGLPANTTYYYFVRAVNSTDEGAYTEAVSERTLLAPLSAPNNVTATALSTNSIEVTWGAVTGAVSYKVYRATSVAGTKTLLNTVTTTSFTSGGLSATSYYYFITTLNADNVESDYSAYASMIPIPNVPGSVTAKGVSYSFETSLSWNAVTGAASYRVYYSTSPTGTKTLVGTPAGRAYTHTGLTANTTYYYWVTAVNAGGESDYSVQASALTAPAAPTGLKVVTTTTSSISITWDAIAGAAGYYFVIEGDYFYDYFTQNDPSDRTLDYFDLPSKTTVTFTIQAFNSAGLYGPSVSTMATTK